MDINYFDVGAEDNGFFNLVRLPENLTLITMPTKDNTLYFGIMDESDIDNLKFCRISMEEPKYMNLSKNETLKLSKSQLNIIIDFLNNTKYEHPLSFHILGKHVYKSFNSGWEFILFDMNYELSNVYWNGKDEIYVPMNFPIPDYSKLETID